MSIELPLVEWAWFCKVWRLKVKCGRTVGVLGVYVRAWNGLGWKSVYVPCRLRGYELRGSRCGSGYRPHAGRFDGTSSVDIINEVPRLNRPYFPPLRHAELDIETIDRDI